MCPRRVRDALLGDLASRGLQRVAPQQMPPHGGRARSLILALVLTTAVALAVSAAPAVAATIAVERGVVTYRSWPGEKDNVQISDALSLVLPSRRHTIGAGCVDETPPFATSVRVRCSPRGTPQPGLRMYLGDRDDEVEAETPLRGVFHGGRGNDSITFGIGVLYGGPGDDDLLAVGARPVIHGGPGNDDAGVNGSVTGTGRSPARIYGGPGHDLVSGDGGADLLSGGAGRDNVQGLGGRDVLYPGPGEDEVDADEGADLVRARDGRLDYIDCWDGRDTAVLDRFDLYERDCERVRRRGVARPVLYGAGVHETASGTFKELEIDFTCPFDGARVCDPIFLVHSSHGRVLRGWVKTRRLGDQGWLWTLRPRVLVRLTKWARITMVAHDALGRPFRQTLVCPRGVVVNDYEEPYEGESAAVGHGHASSANDGGARPLTNSRTCWPPILSLNPFVE